MLPTSIVCLAALGLMGCAGTPSPGPADPRIVPVEAWGGTTAPPAARSHRVTRVTLHHQGVTWNPQADVAAYLRRLQQWSRESKRWADVPYHFVVAPDGTAYRGRALSTPGDTNTEYDPAGHLQVMLLGNFEHQQPTPAQWEGTVGLLAHLLRSHGLDAAALGTHREFSRQTVCPGENLVRRFEDPRAEVTLKMR